MFLRLAFVSVLLAWCATPRARSAEPFLKPNDVIALVGGEDMVVAAEDGYLELLLQRGLPGYHLKVRSLAWEGDTVFEQQRDLNYPTLEQQLDEIGATVVIMQFGQMESLAGTSKLPEFITAYEKLIERVGKEGKRRIIVISPPEFLNSVPDLPLEMAEFRRQQQALHKHKQDSAAYGDAIAEIAARVGHVDAKQLRSGDILVQRDGIHLNDVGQGYAAWLAAAYATNRDEKGLARISDDDHLLATIRAKNRLWFHYYRPQNWAFLAGDRTEQPSSRDWKDPSKRWFPEEMKQYLPLIDQKEKEIWALAAKAAKP